MLFGHYVLAGQPQFALALLGHVSKLYWWSEHHSSKRCSSFGGLMTVVGKCCFNTSVQHLSYVFNWIEM